MITTHCERGNGGNEFPRFLLVHFDEAIKWLVFESRPFTKEKGINHENNNSFLLRIHDSDRSGSLNPICGELSN